MDIPDPDLSANEPTPAPAPVRAPEPVRASRRPEAPRRTIVFDDADDLDVPDFLKQLIELLNAGFTGGVTGGFTTRDGGVSLAAFAGLNLAGHVGDDPAAIAANRAELAAVLGARRLVSVNQVHGAAVHVVGGLQTATATADAMVTDQPGVALAILVADCLPVLIADAEHGVVAAAHAGRVGLAAGVLPATVEAMVALGGTPAAMTAVIGPGICGRCYEVPVAMRDDVNRLVPGSASISRTGTASLDLAAGAAELLAGLGIGRVCRTDVCTLEDEQFYSYRRDGITGRFAGVVMLAGND